MTDADEHDIVKVTDPTVMGLNTRCKKCGACDCHTSYLMNMGCSEVTAGVHRIYMHSGQRDKVSILNPNRKGSEDLPPPFGTYIQPEISNAVDLHDEIGIRKVALECSVRMIRSNEVSRDVIVRANAFEQWIKTGEY